MEIIYLDFQLVLVISIRFYTNTDFVEKLNPVVQ